VSDASDVNTARRIDLIVVVSSFASRVAAFRIFLGVAVSLRTRGERH